MADFLASGRLIDAILALVAIEAIGLSLYWRMTRRGIAPADLLPMLTAGASLLLAFRLSLGGSDWLPVCASLAAAGFASALDIVRRWRS